MKKQTPRQPKWTKIVVGGRMEKGWLAFFFLGSISSWELVTLIMGVPMKIACLIQLLRVWINSTYFSWYTHFHIYCMNYNKRCVSCLRFVSVYLVVKMDLKLVLKSIETKLDERDEPLWRDWYMWPLWLVPKVVFWLIYNTCSSFGYGDAYIDDRLELFHMMFLHPLRDLALPIMWEQSYGSQVGWLGCIS